MARSVVDGFFSGGDCGDCSCVCCCCCDDDDDVVVVVVVAVVVACVC